MVEGGEKVRRSDFLLRIAALPEQLRQIVLDDIEATIENRIRTMEKLAEGYTHLRKR